MRGQGRRAFLRSAAAAIALPLLESQPARSAGSGKRAPAAPLRPPLRFAVIYFSNGVEPVHWWARGRGDTMELGPVLEAMKPHRKDMVFLRGLFNAQARAHKSPHLGRAPNLLSGGWVSTDQNEIRCAASVDQVLAEQIGGACDIPSLVLGIEPTELRLEDGLSMIYGSCISWVSPTKPASKEIYPARVFDLLVGSRDGRALDRSVLDEVSRDARALRPQLDAPDRAKLDEYLGSVRDVERRIQRAARERRFEGTGWRPALTAPDMARPKDGVPQDVPEHMRLMLDLIVLAFRMDRTRIATYMMNNDLSQMNFGFLPGVRGALHLDLTHNGHDPVREAMYLKTNQFHLGQFAYLVERLRACDEGGQSLLHNSLLLCCSNFLDGDKHQADEMTMLLAGSAGGALETGRVLDYLDKGDDHRRACSLYLSLMDLMGLRLPKFGDADQRLAGLVS
jgi:hypothetical protein